MCKQTMLAIIAALSLVSATGPLLLEKNAAELNKHCPRQCSESSSSSSSGEFNTSFFEQRPQVLQLDAGFYPFNFGVGNAGLNAFSSFFFTTPVSFRVILTDCFCTGDSFMLLNNGVQVALFNEDCLINDNQCSFYSTNPRECLSGAWCGGYYDFFGPPSFFNFTIRVLTSPYQAGSGYIGVQQICGTVPCCSSGPVDECNYNVVEDDSESGCHYHRKN